jgi:NADP-dependent 3-hydroxy acid dehydrogenase YdfG
MAAETATVVGEFIVEELDIRNPDSIAQLVCKHQNWLKGLDVLVNNAGLALGRNSLQESAADELRTMVDTNILGLLEMTRATLPFMVARKKGHVVNLGSIAAITPYAGGTVYCATKAAVHAATLALRQDLAGTGVRVTTVAPGRVAETEFSEVRYGGDKEKAKQVYQGYRVMTAQDVAETIAWIVERPAHVCVQEIVLMPTDQPNSTTVVPLK